MNLIFLLRAVAGEGGGGNQMGAKRRFGEDAGVDTPPAGGGPGTSPEHF